MGARRVLVIRAPSATGPRVEAAFVQPSLDVTSIPFEVYQDYVGVLVRSINDWAALFSLWKSEAILVEEEDEHVSTDLSTRLERAATTLPTPSKRARDEDQIEEDSPMSIYMREVPIDPEHGDLAIAAITKNLNELASGYADLKDLVTGLKYSQASLDAFRQRISDKVNLMQLIMGERPSDLLAVTIWESLGQLLELTTPLKGLTTTLIPRN
jgi:hypothetical protein